jgi:hypothetical protein
MPHRVYLHLHILLCFNLGTRREGGHWRDFPASYQSEGCCYIYCLELSMEFRDLLHHTVYDRRAVW